MGELLEGTAAAGTGDRKARKPLDFGATPLRHKIQDSLDETRMLIMGAQVLVGALYDSSFEPGYDRLPHASQVSAFAALGLILIAFSLFVLPVAHHRIVEHGLDDEEFHGFLTRVMSIALIPFSLSLGITLYVAVAKLSEPAWAFAAGAFGSLLAVRFWYGIDIRLMKNPVCPGTLSAFGYRNSGRAT